MHRHFVSLFFRCCCSIIALITVYLFVKVHQEQRNAITKQKQALQITKLIVTLLSTTYVEESKRRQTMIDVVHIPSPLEHVKVDLDPGTVQEHARAHVHTHTRTHSQTHTYTHTLTNTHIHKLTHSQTHTNAHTHARTYTHIHTRTHELTHMHTRTHTHTHTYTHTYKQAHTHSHTHT